MPSLSVRRLDEDTISRLRIRAAQHGVSMEEEARRILKDAVSAPDHLGDLALRGLPAEDHFHSPQGRLGHDVPGHRETEQRHCL